MKYDSKLTHALIPGGAHTYSKGDDQFPSNAPKYLEKGNGAYVWDENDNRYIDWTMGLRTMTLGYNCESVDNAAIKQIKKGLNFGRPSYIETELAQDLVDIIPSAEMVKYAKNGSAVTTAAVKLARAYTGRKYVAFCKNHPFFSFDDWFIGTTEVKSGIPDSFTDYSLPFQYNNIDSLAGIFEKFPGDVAAIILEPCVSDSPQDNFLERVAEMAKINGTVLIFDEMITGFRWHLGGAQTYFNVIPDMSTFGKGISNGYSVCALVGKKEIMNLGGINHAEERVFLLSSTHGAENSSLAAARECLRIYREEPVIEHLWDIGKQLIDGMNELAMQFEINEYFQAFGYGCRPEYICRDSEKKISLPMRTLFMQEMIRKKILLAYIVPSYAHQSEHVEKTLSAVKEALKVYKAALSDGWNKYLEGDVIKPVFRKYN